MSRSFCLLGFVYLLSPGLQGEEAGDFCFEKELYLIPSLEQLKQKSFAGQLSLKQSRTFRAKGSYAGMIQHGHVQDPSWEWDWGVRTVVGVEDLPGDWNLSAAYTQFHTKSFANAKSPDGVLLPTWEEEKEVDSAWMLHLNLADMEIGKDLRVAQTLVLRPHVGLRGAWMYQRCLLPQRSGLVEEKPKFAANNCTGVGLRSGVDSFWAVYKGTSLFGDGAISLLSGYYNLEQLSQISPPNGIAMAEISFGMQYEKAFLSTRKLTFRLGYEMNYLFNRMRWLDGFSHDKKQSPQDGSGIPLQGVTLGLRLEF